jgi:hypothetical protein
VATFIVCLPDPTVGRIATPVIQCNTPGSTS